MKNKLVLIDGNSILYRSFYALPSLMTADGQYTNAIYGFANILVKTINELKPTHIGVAFDVAKKTFRNDIYSDYKATRKPMPEELRSQVAPVKEMLKLMNITVLEKDGLEADDILGTISKRFDNEAQIIIVTGDRDTLQLISKTTSIYFTKKGISDVKIMDKEALREEYGIEAESIVDLKALQGDTSDNIPGVFGIGEKTALELVQKYGTIKNIYKNIEEIKQNIRNKLIVGKDMAEMSYKLAKINREVDIDCKLEDLTYDFPFSEQVYEFMEKCRFNSLLKREDIFGKKSVESKKLKFECKNIESINHLQNMLKTIEENGLFSAYIDDDDNFYFSSGENEWIVRSVLDMFSFLGHEGNIYGILKPIFENENIRKLFFDSKLMRHKLQSKGINICGKFEDISIMAHLVEGVSIKYPEDVLEGPGLNIKNPARSICLVYNSLLEKLKEYGMEKLYYEVELPLSVVLFDMENAGFKVDRNRVDELGSLYKTEIDSLVDHIYKLAGERFNINSAKQLGDILYDKLALPHNRKKSTSAEVLQEIVNSHEIVPVILRYRKVTKLYSTYIEGLKPHIDKNSIVHTSFKQTLTTTGRLSSVEPNLQNIPIRSDESREVRSIYVARSEDNVLIDADYSQIELRLLAHFSGDPFFMEAFNKGYDIHTQTACQVFGVLKENVTSEMRRIAKIVNFGIIYGISDYGLALDLKTSTKEARAFIENFYANHPKVREYMDEAVKTARETGRVSTLLGRTRRMLDINSSNYLIRTRAERASQNMPLQGSAADIIKLAMLKVYKALKEGKYEAKLIMQVHDELIIDCPIKEKDAVEKLVREAMNSAYELKVPLVCDVTSSYRWSDGH